MEQKTVNLVIVIAAVVIAAGAWSAPLLTAQTTHTLIQGDLADAITTINQNTDSETGQIGAGFFGAGTDLDASFGDCTLMDLMISIALDENINQLCSPDTIQAFIESDIHFADFNDQFEFEEVFLEILPMELLPNRDCTGTDLTDAKIFSYQVAASAATRFIQPDATVDGGAGAAANPGEFGAAQCIHQFSFEDTPLQVKSISLQDNSVANEPYNRLQLAFVDTEDPDFTNVGPVSVFCGDVANFERNVVFDGVFDLSAGVAVIDTKTISGDLMILFPPNGNANLCARIATTTPTTDDNFAAYVTVQDILPLSIINFIPPAAFQFFDFEHFAPIDFTDSCNIRVLVEDFNGNPIQNIPVTLLDPFLDGAINGPANAEGTDVNGIAVIGAGIDIDQGAGQMPSAFYVIDVNVDEQGIAVAVDNDFGQSFPDRFVDCTDDDNVAGLDEDAIVGTITILAQLPQFGGAGFEGATIGVFAEDPSTGQAIPNITLTLSGTGFDGNAFVFADGEQNQVTDSFGEVEFEGLNSNLDGLPGGEYTITFAGGGGFQSATTMVFLPPGFSGFIDVFLPISPT